ncbi:MAG TPA: hypothetical protein VG326_00875 [Tepidisphaeraceae bacterium]|jgi:hypothetical protein|nr:hypothetical protein [Tepidisphaeraceae bacterium]
MQKINSSLALIALGLFAVGGCHKAGDSPTVEPTTMTAPPTNGMPAGPTTMAVPPANQTEVALPAAKPPAAKDLTHVLTKDEPYYLNEPGANPTAVGTLKAGSKVLVLIPGSPYSQVLTDTGISAYIMTDGLKPLGK